MRGIRVDYGVLAEALRRAGVALGVSELHGGICGTMCGGGREATGAWLADCLRDCDPRARVLEEIREQMSGLELGTWQTLIGSELHFEPLIPDDDRALEERVGALALWCHGFLVGLGFSGVSLEPGAAAGAEHLEEIVSDFLQIARAALGTEESRNREQADFALAELTEYVRVSVQIVFEELRALRGPDAGERPLH